MIKVTDILKRCEISRALGILTAGIPAERCEKVMKRYYSLYCCLLEAWTPEDHRSIAVTDFRHRSGCCRFYGIPADSPQGAEKSQPLNLYDSFKAGDVLLFPECFLFELADELIAAVILYQAERKWPSDIPERSDRKLFSCVKKNRKKAENIQHAVRFMEWVMHDHTDRRLVVNDLAEYRESRAAVFKWKDLLEIDGKEQVLFLLKSNPLKDAFARALRDSGQPDSLSEVLGCFLKMDPDNPPDALRGLRQRDRINSAFSKIGLTDYMEVSRKHKRILIEKNPASGEHPLIYIRDLHGNRTELSKEELSSLLCMDIYVMERELAGRCRILALLLFCLEYPIRAGRLQKDSLYSALTGMLSLRSGLKEGRG